jgi:hypothetical protein
VAEYPAAHRNDLVARLRSRRGNDHSSAVFEIIVFACLRSLDYEVTVHPELPGGRTRRPDFLAARDGEGFYVEAVLASEFSAEEKAARRQLHIIYQAISSISSPDFALDVHPRGVPPSDVRTRQLKRDLVKWLGGLDVEKVRRAWAEQATSEALPKKVWNEGEWSITFRAWPRASTAHSPVLTIGVQFSGVRWVNVWMPVRDAIVSKGNYYGRLDRPLVVAVNIDAAAVSRSDEIQALFGHEETIVFLDSDRGPEWNRAPDGAWTSHGGPRYRRIAGAWLFRSADAWNFVRQGATLYINPWADHELHGRIVNVASAIVRNDEVQFRAGHSLAEVLNVHSRWPEGPAAP